MRLLALSAALLFLIGLHNTGFAQDVSIEGTYVLESRVLADGSVVKPPAIIGLYNIEAGYVNFNLAQSAPDGKVHSMSLVGVYTFTPAQFTQEIIYFSVNDEMGIGAQYDFENKSGSSPVTVKDGVIEFVFPPHDKVKGRFEGKKFTATRVDGAYIDNWKKVD